MKGKLNLIVLVVIGVFVVILFFGFILSNIDPDNKLEAYTLAISFVGVFATFGGAYLGAKISGDSALKLEKIISEEKKENQIIKNKVLIKMNLDNLQDIFYFMCKYFCIDMKGFIQDLKNNRFKLYEERYIVKNLSEREHIIFLEEHMSKCFIMLEWKNSVFDEIDEFTDICKSISFELHNFKIHEQQIIFQLKQILPKFKKYLSYNENDETYSFRYKSEQDFENFKGLFMLFSLLFIDLYEEVLDLNLFN